MVKKVLLAEDEQCAWFGRQLFQRPVKYIRIELFAADDHVELRDEVLQKIQFGQAFDLLGLIKAGALKEGLQVDFLEGAVAGDGENLPLLHAAGEDVVEDILGGEAEHPVALVLKRLIERVEVKSNGWAIVGHWLGTSSNHKSR